MFVKIGNKVETDAEIQKLNDDDYIVMQNGISVARCVFRQEQLIIVVANYENIKIELCHKRLTSILHYSGMHCDFSVKGELQGIYYMKPNGYEYVGMGG